MKYEKNKGKTCIYGDNSPAFSKGRCKKCYRKDFESKVGAGNGKSYGKYSLTKSINHAGYVTWYEPTSPHASSGGRVYEHRYVMGECIGRPLLPHENVHHKNGDRADNRLENLELWSTKQPIGQRVDDKVAFAREILALYQEFVDGKKFSA